MNVGHAATTPIDQVRTDIDTHGYALRIGHIAEPQPSPWTYTIGFTALNHPELVFTNFSEPAARHVANTMLHAVQNGHTFNHGDMIHGITPACPLAIIATPQGYAWHIADDLYGPFNVLGLHVISPDRNRKFPWEPGSELADMRYGTPPEHWNAYTL